jgi:hypothetical protein
MQHRGGQRGFGEEREPEQGRGAQAERERAERDHRRDLFGRQAENRIRAQPDRTAAQRIQPDIVADGVAHEGDQGEPRVGDARARELEPQGIVQSQATVSRRREHHSRHELRGLDRPHVLEDVPPSVLADDVMQPEQRDHEQDDPEERRPRRDLSNCVRNCQAAYRSRGAAAPCREGVTCRGLASSMKKLLGLCTTLQTKGDRT